MKRIWAGSLGIVMGLTPASGWADDDVVWKAVKPKPVAELAPVAVTPAPAVVARGVADDSPPAAPDRFEGLTYLLHPQAPDGSEWRKVRGQSGDAPPRMPLAAETNVLIPVQATMPAARPPELLWQSAKRRKSPADIELRPKVGTPETLPGPIGSAPPAGPAVPTAPPVGAPVLATPTVAGAPCATGIGPALPYQSPNLDMRHAAAPWYRHDVPLLWFSAEYLAWWTNRDTAPALVSTTVGPGAANASLAGRLTTPGTSVLFGGDLNESFRTGGRFTAGLWLDYCHESSIEASFFFLSRRGYEQSFSSDQFPALARPIFAVNGNPVINGQTIDIGLPGEYRELVAFPTLARGTVTVQGSSGLWGAELNPRRRWCAGCNYTVDAFAGFRYLDLDEDLSVTEFIQITGNVGPLTPPGTNVIVRDSFATQNRFYGGQIGLDGEYRWGRVSLGLKPRIALGVTDQTLDISGTQFIQPPGGVAPLIFTTGGLLGSVTNNGRHRNTAFSVVPQVTVSAGLQLLQNLRLTAAYDFFLWTNVIRPGQQIDRNVDVGLLPPPGSGFPASGLLRPEVQFNQSSYVAHGLSVGLQLKW